MENSDADFNILTLFVLKEIIKGKNSFYYHWFEITPENYSMFSWNKEELDTLDDPSVKEYAI